MSSSKEQRSHNIGGATKGKCFGYIPNVTQWHSHMVYISSNVLSNYCYILYLSYNKCSIYRNNLNIILILYSKYLSNVTRDKKQNKYKINGKCQTLWKWSWGTRSWVIRNIMDIKVVVYHIAGMIKTESETHRNTLLSLIEKEHTCAHQMCS